MFFKTKICRNKIHIYPEVEVHVAKQNPTEFIELDYLVLLNTEISYKKKRGNQRIEEQPNKSYFEKSKEKREIERGDVRIILGASTDKEDK